MRKIPITEIKPGMKLAKTIYRADDGRILLNVGSELKESHIQRLAEYNCESVVVDDVETESEEEIALKPIKDETREKAVTLLKQSIKQIKTEGAFECEDLTEVIKEIIEYIISDPRLFII